MATPSVVSFSLIGAPFESLLERLSPIFESQKLELKKASRLGWNGSLFEAIGEDFVTASEADALDWVRKKRWEGVALFYFIHSIYTDMWIDLRQVKEDTCINLEVTGQALSFQEEGYRQGEWLEKFLCSVTSALEPAVCGYGTLHSEAFEPLEPSAILKLLESGALLTARSPSFHMIHHSLVDDRAFATLLAAHPRNQRLRYARTTSGYHMLSEMP